MKPILHTISGLRTQYLIFIITVILTIVVTQLITQYDLNEQNEDARQINIAGRQRMLSQRIAKLTLYIQHEFEYGEPAPSRYDTLRKLVTRWNQVHFGLLNGSSIEGLSPEHSRKTDSLLTAITPLLRSVVDACNQLLEHRDLETANRTVATIAPNEIRFLNQMELIVATYQYEAEKKLRNLKRLELGLATSSIVILFMEFAFIFLPALRSLKSANAQLSDLNNELGTSNEELQSTEEELRSNLDYITALQEEMSAREKQFREVVENASDMIYELDEHGKFRYVNPVMESISGYSRNDLMQKFYGELIHPDHREEVVRFYQQQRKNKTEVSYLEFPIVSRDGAEVWVGQNVRMFFRDQWVFKVGVVAREITMLIRAQLALRESEELFRSLSVHAPVGIYRLDAAGSATFINEKWYDIVGLPLNASREERINSIHEEDRERVLTAWATALQNRQELNIEFRYRSPRRGIIHVANQVHPIYAKDLEVIGFIGTTNDITLTKEAQQRIEESERLYRLISTNSKDLITLHQADATQLYISPSVKEILGYDPEELVGDTSLVNLMDPEDRQKLQENAHVKTMSGIAAFAEYRIRKKDGSIAWMEANSNPFFDETGKMMGFQTSARDITERKQAELALQQSEQRFRSLAEKAPVGIFQTDIQGKVTYMSDRWGEIAGLDIRLALGRGWASAIHPDDRAMVFTAWQDALNARKEFDAMFRLQNPSGVRWVRGKATPLFNEEEELTGYIGTLHDITAIKEAELKLVEAKEKAEDATRAKSQFLSMMSHEIRTPMNAIIGLSNLLLEEAPRPDQLESMKLLKFSGENLLTIINDILDFSKIEAGKITLEKVDFDLHDRLRNIHQMLEPRALEKNIGLRFSYGDNLPDVVKGDPVRIGQIITNLLSNAVKFTEQGHVALTVTGKRNADGKFTIRFAVTDTGIGIAPEKVKVIFESFSQANTDTTRKFGGTGLGLSITKRLLHLMQSEIEVTSTSGEGSTFSFVLTLEEGRQEKTIAVQKKAPLDFGGKKIRVLVAEDNRVNQVVALNFLKKWNIDVEFAQNGKEAVSMIQNKSYQLVLMDLQMPEMDGYEATKTIRSLDGDPYFQRVPIIALTASAMIDIREKVIAMGMTDFLSKPFLPEELHSTIAKYVFVAEPEPAAPAYSEQISVNLDVYTDNDPDFKQELAGLVLKNLQELREALKESIKKRSPDIFKIAAHKMKTSAGMLGNREFLEIIERLPSLMEDLESEPLKEQVDRFHALSSELMEILEKIASKK